MAGTCIRRSERISPAAMTGLRWVPSSRPSPGSRSPSRRWTASGIHGRVVALDGPFGNLVTNVDRDEFAKLGYQPGDTVRVTVGSSTLSVPFHRTFGEVAPGKPLLYIDSRGLVSLAINQGNFAEKYKISPPAPLVIARK